MTVLLRKSSCIDCIWRESCQRLAKIEGIADNRDSVHNVDVFEVIILNCSLKNYDRSYRTKDNNSKKLFFCTECNQMHHEGSRIGINHKAKMEDERQERVKENYLREGTRGENFKRDGFGK